MMTRHITIYPGTIALLAALCLLLLHIAGAYTAPHQAIILALLVLIGLLV